MLKILHVRTKNSRKNEENSINWRGVRRCYWKKRSDQLIAAKKGLETQIENLTIDLDEAKTRVEEQLIVIRKLQVQLDQLKELELELEAANEQKESLSRQLRDAEKKVKQKDLEIEDLIAKQQANEG